MLKLLNLARLNVNKFQNKKYQELRINLNSILIARFWTAIAFNIVLRGKSERSPYLTHLVVATIMTERSFELAQVSQADDHGLTVTKVVQFKS